MENNENKEIREEVGAEETSESQTSSDGVSADVPQENGEEFSLAGAIWTYDEQLTHDRKALKKAGRKSALTFAAVMAGVFAAAIAVLLLVIFFGSELYKTEKTVYRETVVYVREDGTVGGKLSVGEVYNKVSPSTVEVKVTRDGSSGTGTGIVMSSDGYILTNAHVVENAKTVSVKMHDSNVFKASLVGIDVLADVAVIKIAPGSYSLTPAEFGKSSELLVGETVVAIGCPAGHFLTATEGIVSATPKMVEMHDEEGNLEKEMLVIQTSAELNPGNSGGPLINLDGKVIGINSMKLTVAPDGTPYESLGYAIPIDEALVLAERLKAGETTKGEGITKKSMRLGITGGMCSKGEEDGLGGKFEESGVFVSKVSEKSNASGHLEGGDIILTYAGHRIESFDPFSEYVKKMKDGDVLKLTVYREGKVIDVEIKMDIMK